MVVIVTLGLVSAVLATFVLFVLMFIEVAFKPPQASINRLDVRKSGSSEPVVFAGHVTRPPERIQQAAPVAAASSQPLPQVAHAESGIGMNSRLLLSRHTRHLRILVVLIVVGGAGAFLVRSQMIPEAYGDRGPYRSAALGQIAALPVRLTSDATCLKCHANVQEERAESPHQAVRCMHCHGNGHEHIAAATIAATSPDHAIAPAAEWDGDFHSKQDLFITQDRATCLSCHTSVVGMPSSFRSIDVGRHLEEQGAENVNDKNVCFECHTGHSPGI